MGNIDIAGKRLRGDEGSLEQTVYISYTCINVTCSTYFTVTHLIAIGYISQQKVSELVTYQSLYSSVLLGGWWHYSVHRRGVLRNITREFFLLSVIILLIVLSLLDDRK